MSPTAWTGAGSSGSAWRWRCSAPPRSALLVWFDAMSLVPLFAVAVLLGIGRAFAMPALGTIAPNLVPAAILPSAIALNSIAWQIGMVAGPLIGGAALCRLDRPALRGLGVALRRLARGDDADPADPQGQCRRFASAAGGDRGPRLCPRQQDRARRDQPRSVRGAAWAAPPRCCRSMPATSSMSAPRGSARSAPRPRWARR